MFGLYIGGLILAGALAFLPGRLMCGRAISWHGRKASGVGRREE
jgi:hypothetical protein